MHEYVIKKPETAGETDGRAYVHYKSWQETYEGLIDPAYRNKTTLEKCLAIAHSACENVLIAKDGDKTIGFVGFGEYRGGDIHGFGEIYGIYVLKAYHGKKIGYSLMNAAIKELSEYKKIALRVLKGNERAIRFYERYGFYFDGTENQIMLGTPNTKLRMIYERN